MARITRTIQRTQLIKKAAEEMDLGITIECVDCRTSRTFRVTNQLEAVVEEELRSFGIIIECEECGHMVDVAVGWYQHTPGDPRNSFRTVGRGPGFQQVIDPVGLKRPAE
jgi:hypothetical protein